MPVLSHLSRAKLRGYWLLMRADKPIGIYLLLWPCVWALWIANQGIPSWHLCIVFGLGVFIMRSAGCVINDYADRKVDGAVARTQTRPLVTGQVTEKEALGLFFILILCAFLLVLTLNWQTIMLSLGGVILATIYPFMKRYTHLPQVVLGAAFSWSIPMAFVASGQPLSWHVWALYLANLCWTVAYDTQYAMVDKADDLKVGIKSTAILFGRFDRMIIVLLQLAFVLVLTFIAIKLQFSWPYYLALGLNIMLFAYQFRLLINRQPSLCFKAFLHNHYIGLVFALGIFAHYW
ncbi:4-hydroxybenzoate octaprenyltransferase [Paraglaciecola aestuariivivens]